MNRSGRAGIRVPLPDDKAGLDIPRVRLEGFRWWVSELEERPDTDWVTWFPDVLIGYRLYKFGIVHDYFYRGRTIPGYGQIQTQREADVFGAKTTLKVIAEGVVSGPLFLPHLMVGLILVPLIFLAVRIAGRFAYQPTPRS